MAKTVYNKRIKYGTANSLLGSALLHILANNYQPLMRALCFQESILKPALQIKSKNADSLLNEIQLVIESVDCRGYFSDHIGKSQSEQKVIVSRFQAELLVKLSNQIELAQWQSEYNPISESRDSIDIYGQTENAVIAIELDKHRADQVAKKFISRMAILPNTKVYFISLCYPGTANMSKPETLKYFGYCSNLSERMGNVYAGFTVE